MTATGCEHVISVVPQPQSATLQLTCAAGESDFLLFARSNDSNLSTSLRSPSSISTQNVEPYQEMIASHGSNIGIRCVCMAVLLLLIVAEILATVIMCGLKLFHSETPLHFGSATLLNVLYVCLLAPLVFLSFACLSLLFAAYGRDETTIRVSVALQAASWLLILIGLAGYLFVDLLYFSWAHVAYWFYAYVAVQVELAVTIFLTLGTKRKISPDWEMQASLCPEKALAL